jgi:CheY-like chemotaxis protein
MKTILQVEDDSNDVMFLQRAMQKAQVANPLQVATDGQQAIDYLKGAGKYADRDLFPLPCLVLLDLKLPHVMGLDVLKWIRQQSGLALVVVLLTASSEEADVAAAYGLGANAFLTKPSEMTKLQDMVKAIKDFWLTHNTVPQDNLFPSPLAADVSRAHSSPSAFTASRQPTANAAGREAWDRKPAAKL